LHNGKTGQQTKQQNNLFHTLSFKNVSNDVEDFYAIEGRWLASGGQ
jgi:hypothetical protein